MVALSEKWSAKGSIGVKDIQTDQTQIVVSTNQKKKTKVQRNFLPLPDSFAA